jgi:hypothetical protein
MLTDIMEEVLKDEEDGDLGQHCPPGRERYMPSLHTELFGGGMEKPNL